ncbi:glycosyltransferase [Streptacidiphilus sp. PB12-B1b]|uniref:glycosyltransferase family 2 protein n=1 Tax=Streptacidiphilus sp. PB12-B1b TaxID=2705012 RepID=UPI0015FB32BE|nr:glycosyltransferase family 2 protein [Streptacidiphilus sp. PB12-B1b]QMU75306.1 glycosyltransferase [Streptacidiphilus sp. PB12-B1b]
MTATATPYGHPTSGRPPAYPRHLVTAVLVAHDGARWLPQALNGLFAQDRPVQRILAADTGSTDRTPQLLADALGPDAVRQYGRRTGFGTAVNETVRGSSPLRPEDLPYAIGAVGYDPVEDGGGDQFGDPLGHHDELAADQLLAGGSTEPVEWLWLLHDDCEPAPDALRKLLQVAETTPTAAVVGPKLRSWYDRRQLLEVGVSIARSGRRWTGLDRREQDQGQRDQVRPVLSVSTAGMLIRRDVFEQLGGFDKALPLMRDDVDLCWRVAAAGHRTVVAPDAAMRHAEAASRERRPIDCARPGHPHRIDKAGAVFTLLANSRGLLLPYLLLRITLSTLLRALGYLLGKTPGQAVDELAGLAHVLLRFGAVVAARGRRRRTRSPDAIDDRSLFPAPGATTRAAVENLVAEFAGRTGNEAMSSRHGSVESGPVDDDAEFLEIEQFARLKRIARKPAPVLFAGLLLITLVACRNLIGTGALYGGALLPTPGGAGDLWQQYAATWQANGVGSAGGAPPYLGVLAALATLTFGNPSLAVGLVLILAVPLAGVSAYLVSRPLIASRFVRAWASAGYALLPAATGALAQGRIGTAILAVLLPPLARAAAIAVGLGIRRETAARGGRPGWRSAWVAALLLTLTTAFVPLAWVLGLLLMLGALIAALLRGGAFGSGVSALRSLGLRCLVIAGTPLLVLAPWSLGLFAHPGRLLLEAGIPGAVGPTATPTNLLLLSPGGSGAVPGVLVVGIVLAALAALLRADRRRAVVAAWGGACVGLLGTVLTGTAKVVPGPGQAPVSVWAGPATLIAGIALLSAAAIGADGARARVAGIDFGWRQPVAAVVLLTAGLAPVAAAGWWVVRGADGPLARGNGQLVPAFIAQQADSVEQVRTLVLRTGDNGGVVSYALVRGAGPTVGSAEATDATKPSADLGALIGNLVAGAGGDPASQLADYAVQYIQVLAPVSTQVSDALDGTPGLTRLNEQQSGSIWRLTQNVARAAIQAPGSADVNVPSGAVDVHATIPSGSSGRVLRLADSADPGWHATLDGTALTPTAPVDGWAQGFQLPANGGRLAVSYSESTGHVGWIAGQCFLALVVLVLALPGRRDRRDDDQPEDGESPEALAAAADVPAPGSRRARRLAAEAPDGPQAPGDPLAPGDPVAPGGEAAPGQDPFQPFDPAAAADPGPAPDADAPATGPAAEPAPAFVPSQQSWEQQGYPQQPAAQPYGWDQYQAPAQPYEQQEYEQQSYEQAYPVEPGYQQPYYPEQPYPEQPQPYQEQPYYGEGYPAEPGRPADPGYPPQQGYDWPGGAPVPGQAVPQHDTGAYGSLPPDDPWLQGNDTHGTHHDGTGN